MVADNHAGDRRRGYRWTARVAVDALFLFCWPGGFCLVKLDAVSDSAPASLALLILALAALLQAQL